MSESLQNSLFYEIWVTLGNNNGSSDAYALTEALDRGCVIYMYTEKQLNCHALSCWHHSTPITFQLGPIRLADN